MAEEKTVSAIEKLTAQVKLQNAEVKSMEDLSKLDDAIAALEKSNTDNSTALRESFNQISMVLNNPEADAQQMEQGREQLETLKELAGTEEETRESAKRQEEANELLSRMVSGIDGLAASYDKFVDNLKPSAGLLAGITAAALLFTDPETLFAGVSAAIDGVFAIIDSIKMIFEGDISGALGLLGDNIGSVSVIIGTIGIFFGGKIIRAFGGIFKAINIVLKGIQAFRIFMMGTFIPSIMGFFSAIAAPLAPIVAAAAPFLLIGAAIVGTVAALTSAFGRAKEVFEETGSITETMLTFATDIVTAPIRWIKNLSAWILSKLGFEELATKLGEFDITKTITDTVMGTIEWVKGLFTDPVAALEKLSMALIGPDGILGVITAPIDKAINWVMGLFGIKDPESDFSLYDTLYNPIDKTITWLQGLFTDPVAALQQAWNGLVGEGGLLDILYSPIDAAINWVMGLFGWGDPEEPFNLLATVKGAFKSAKDWVLSKFMFASDLATEGWTSLKDFISGKFTKAKDWILGKFTFASDLATEGWTNLSSYIMERFTKAKDWILGKFTFASNIATEGWTNLKDFISGKFTATKEWFTGLFSWSADESESNMIMDLFNSTIEKVKTFFTDLFDFIPSLDEITGSLTSMLPQWMQPASIEEQRAKLLEQLAEMEANAAAALPAAEQFDNPLTNDTREDFEAEAAAIRTQLESLPQANMGGIINAPKAGTPVMLHGQEIVAPLESPQGKVLMAINELMNAKAASGTGEYGSPQAAAMVVGGSNSNSTNNNVNTTNYTIQQGVTPDDFLKREFINFSY